jgi:glycosyltransferase involved in cell wall biosynthesis
MLRNTLSKAMQIRSEGLACKGSIVSVGVNLVPQSGGTFRTVLGFYKALTSKDWAVQIYNFSRYRAEDLPEGSTTFSTTRVPVGRAYQWSHHMYGKTITSAIRNADLVMIHGIYVHPLLQAARMAMKLGIPYILVPHGSLDPYSLTHHRWRKRAWLSLYREVLFARAAAVLYGSEIERNRSAASGIERRAECIPWTVVAKSAAEKVAARETIRLRHGLRRDRQIALFCARIARVKRLAETIRAFLREAPRHWVLLCVGPATSEVDMDEIRTLCAGSEGRCIYVGPMFGQAVKDYYAAADLFVLLSHSENFGHSAGEALAQGVPVVLSPGVALAGYVQRYGGGFVAGGDSFEDMCRALRIGVHCSAEVLREFGETGRKWVERELNPIAFAERIDALCTSVSEEAHETSHQFAEDVTAGRSL